MDGTGPDPAIGGTNERGYRGPTLATDGVVEVLLDGAPAVVLVRRGRPPFEGRWALPGGFVEEGETVQAACLREVLEETGLDCGIVRLLGVYSDPKRDPRGHVVSAVYVVRPAGGGQGGDDAPDAWREALRGGDDAAEARAFPLDDLPELAFDHAAIVADYVASRGSSGPDGS